jgi:hypothetical protein
LAVHIVGPHSCFVKLDSAWPWIARHSTYYTIITITIAAVVAIPVAVAAVAITICSVVHCSVVLCTFCCRCALPRASSLWSARHSNYTIIIAITIAATALAAVAITIAWG